MNSLISVKINFSVLFLQMCDWSFTLCNLRWFIICGASIKVPPLWSGQSCLHVFLQFANATTNYSLPYHCPTIYTITTWQCRLEVILCIFCTFVWCYRAPSSASLAINKPPTRWVIPCIASFWSRKWPLHSQSYFLTKNSKLVKIHLQSKQSGFMWLKAPPHPTSGSFFGCRNNFWSGSNASESDLAHPHRNAMQ